MPARPEDRTTINIGADLIRAVRTRASEEGRGFSDVVAAAITMYLEGPPRPSEHLIPGLVPVAPGLREEVQVLVAEVRRLLPHVAAAVESHGEVIDTLDAITVELGKRRGAAQALERAAALAPRDE